jgi:hypothetical protein
MITIYYVKDTYRDIKFAVTSMEAVTAYRMRAYAATQEGGKTNGMTYDQWIEGIKVKSIKLYGEDEV